MVGWNHQILGEFLAPGISQFKTANLPDLTKKHPEATHWISNHLLNSVFRGRFSPADKPTVLNVLFRARTAFDAYHRARQLTLQFIEISDPSNPKSRVYFDAVAAWETTLLNVQNAQSVFRHLGGDLFQSGDGSDDERLWLIVNRVKHCGEDIKTGLHTSDYTIPMWMTDEGLVSRDPTARLTWEEVTAHVDSLADVADQLQDPAALAENHGRKAI